MTPKIARYLADNRPATPCLVLDVDRVEENFRAIRDALPLALKSGDEISILSTGAYVTTYASQSFNGFAPLAEHYI